MKKNNKGCLYGSVVLIGYFSIIAFIGFVAAKLFEYSLWVLFAKDAPWLADLAGGYLCSAILLPVSFILWLATNVLGYPVPIIH